MGFSLARESTLNEWNKSLVRWERARPFEELNLVALS